VIDAVLAIKQSRLPYLDRERIGLLGRSLGGGITYDVLVDQPSLVKAAVVYAPVSTDAVGKLNRWTRTDSALAAAITRAYGAPERNPGF
jgi:dienelactone hydrolase